MSDTPRTDEAIKQLLQTSQHERVKADFARELEREITRLTHVAEKLREAGKREIELLNKLQSCQRDLNQLVSSPRVY